MSHRKLDSVEIVKTVSIELADIFWKLEHSYSQPEDEELLIVLKEIENRLTESLSTYEISPK